jgi:hypothetical protein
MPPLVAFFGLLRLSRDSCINCSREKAVLPPIQLDAASLKEPRLPPLKHVRNRVTADPRCLDLQPVDKPAVDGVVSGTLLFLSVSPS